MAERKPGREYDDEGRRLRINRDPAIETMSRRAQEYLDRWDWRDSQVVTFGKGEPE